MKQQGTFNVYGRIINHRGVRKLPYPRKQAIEEIVLRLQCVVKL